MREVIADDLAALEERQRAKAERRARLLMIVRRIAAAYLTVALLTIGTGPDISAKLFQPWYPISD